MGPGVDESVAAAPASSPFAANLRGRAKRADRKRGPTMPARTRQYLFTSESVTEGHPDMRDAAGLGEPVDAGMAA
jgi:hypothetical protein